MFNNMSPVGQSIPQAASVVVCSACEFRWVGHLAKHIEIELHTSQNSCTRFHTLTKGSLERYGFKNNSQVTQTSPKKQMLSSVDVTDCLHTWITVSFDSTYVGID